jgi:hypothetical protein
MSRTDDWGDGWNEGYQEAIRECLAMMEAIHVPNTYGYYTACEYCNDGPYWPPQEYPCDSVRILRELLGEN